MMKSIPPLLFGLAMLASKASAADQIVTLGDSLTFAYEAEFGFKMTSPFTVGDGMPATVRNWVELLSVNRPAYFDLGVRDDINVPGATPSVYFFRQSYNWAIPGLKADGMRQFVAGEAKFNDLLSMAAFNTLLSYSDFNQDTDFALADFRSQVQNVAERVVISIGGNDIRQVYGDIYNGNPAGTFVADFVADINAVITEVQTLKPGIQIVLVNVPHVGITLKVRDAYPYDVVKTERVSAVLRDLNGQLAALATTKGIGYADIYTPTLGMIKGEPLAVYGIRFANQGTAAGTGGPVWLNGPLSDNFHPNTNAQSAIANEVVDAFNRRYNTGIAPFTATEIGGWTAKTANQINVTFDDWRANYSVPTLTPADDSDGDGISAAVEFATGLNPLRHDSWKISSKVTGGQLELVYPRRVPNVDRFTLTVESSSTLASPFTTVTSPAASADGLIHASVPASGSKGFLRLKAVIP